MLARNGKIRWLIDNGLPQVEAVEPNTLPLSHCRRDLITEAIQQGRWVVTANRDMLRSRAVPSSAVPSGAIPPNCPPIAVVDGKDCSEEGLLRNLLHLEFRLLRQQGQESGRYRDGQRFFIDMDRSIYRVNSEGGLEEIEIWKVPSLSVKAVPLWGAPA